jgi:hypothetical protein
MVIKGSSARRRAPCLEHESGKAKGLSDIQGSQSTKKIEAMRDDILGGQNHQHLLKCQKKAILTAFYLVSSMT